MANGKNKADKKLDRRAFLTYAGAYSLLFAAIGSAKGVSYGNEKAFEEIAKSFHNPGAAGATMTLDQEPRQADPFPIKFQFTFGKTKVILGTPEKATVRNLTDALPQATIAQITADGNFPFLTGMLPAGTYRLLYRRARPAPGATAVSVIDLVDEKGKSRASLPNFYDMSTMIATVDLLPSGDPRLRSSGELRGADLLNAAGCFGTFGTLGTIGGCFGTFGTYGCGSGA
jgi:hypothetical protein